MSNSKEEIVCHTCDKLFSSIRAYYSHNCNEGKISSDEESESPPFDILSIPSYEADASLKSSKSSVLSMSSPTSICSSATNHSSYNYNLMEKISPDSYDSDSHQSSQSSSGETQSIYIPKDHFSITSCQSSSSEESLMEEVSSNASEDTSDESLSISINSYTSTDYDFKETQSFNGDNDSTDIVDSEYYLNDDEVSKRVNTYSSLLLSNPSQRSISICHNVHKIESDLLYIIKSNRLPNKLYDELMNWASNAHFSGYFDRGDGVRLNTALKRLADSCCDDVGGAPLCTTMNLPNLPPIDVHYSSFMKHAHRLLNSPHLMCDANWSYQYNGGQRSDLNTGSWWKKAEKNLCKRLCVKSLDESNHVLVPVLIFDDETHCDEKGRIKMQPVLCSLGNITMAKRISSDSWFLLGFIPPNPKTDKELEQEKRSVLSKENALKLYHNSLSILLSEIRCSQRSGGTRMHVHGKGIVTVHFQICCIIGDTKGHSEMCCHFSSFSSQLNRMTRDCQVPTVYGDYPDFECIFTKQSDIDGIVREACANINSKTLMKESRQKLKEISQHGVIPIYNLLGCGGDLGGIYTLCPYEVLHLLYLGLFKYALHSCFNYREPPSNLKSWYTKRINGKIPWDSPHPKLPGASDLPCTFNAAEFERRIRVLVRSAKRQSDRDWHKFNFNNGVTSLTKLSGQEYPGLLLLSAIALEGMLGNRQAEKDFIRVFWYSLSMDLMLSQESVAESFLEKLKKRIRSYLWLYLKVIGPQREIHSSCGLCITKFHALLHFPFYIDKFGSASNFFGGYRESSLRPTVKSWINRTTKQHSRVQQDMMSRYYESLAVDHIKQHHSRQCQPSSNPNQIENNIYFGDEMYKLSKNPFLLIYTPDHGWHTHTTHRWSCTSSCGALYHPCKRDTIGKSWVKKLVDHADSLDIGVDRIGCHMECYVPTDRAQCYT